MYVKMDAQLHSMDTYSHIRTDICTQLDSQLYHKFCCCCCAADMFICLLFYLFNMQIMEENAITLYTDGMP